MFVALTRHKIAEPRNWHIYIEQASLLIIQCFAICVLSVPSSCSRGQHFESASVLEVDVEIVNLL